MPLDKLTETSIEDATLKAINLYVQALDANDKAQIKLTGLAIKRCLTVASLFDPHFYKTMRNRLIDNADVDNQRTADALRKFAGLPVPDREIKHGRKAF